MIVVLRRRGIEMSWGLEGLEFTVVACFRGSQIILGTILISPRIGLLQLLQSSLHLRPDRATIWVWVALARNTKVSLHQAKSCTNTHQLQDYSQSFFEVLGVLWS